MFRLLLHVELSVAAAAAAAKENHEDEHASDHVCVCLIGAIVSQVVINLVEARYGE